MVASGQVEIPYYRDIGRQRGEGFGALAHVIGRTEIQILRKYVVLAAIPVGTNWMEFAEREIAEVVKGKEIFLIEAKSVGKETCKEQLGSGSEQSRVIPTKSAKQTSRSRRDIFTTISH